MQQTNLVVKRRGHSEPFDVKKLYASIYAACRSVDMTEPEAEMIADKVASEVEKTIAKAKLVSSDQIFKLTVHLLKAHHPDIAYMYKHHRDIS